MTGRDPAAGPSRRRADALRLLPVLGAALFLAPDLILGGGEAADGATAPWGAYLFAAWASLVALAALLARPGRGPVAGGRNGADGVGGAGER